MNFVARLFYRGVAFKIITRYVARDNAWLINARVRALAPISLELLHIPRSVNI